MVVAPPKTGNMPEPVPGLAPGNDAGNMVFNSGRCAGTADNLIYPNGNDADLSPANSSRIE